MKLHFKSEIEGKVLFKKIIMYIIAYFVCIIAMLKIPAESGVVPIILIELLLVVTLLALTFKFYEIIIPSISLDDKKFEFTASLGEYIKMNAKGIGLSIITFGIYGAWYLRNMVDFIIKNIKYEEKELNFQGKGSKLFLIILLVFVVELIIIGVIVGIILIMGDNGSSIFYLLSGIIYLVGFVSLISMYLFYVYRWYIDIKFGNESVKLHATLKETFVYIAIQMLLTIVTLGIYGFAAEVNIFRFFTDKIKLVDDSTNAVRNLKFTGITMEGFKLLITITFLSIITVGIYLPWAYAKGYNWFISHLEINDSQEIE